MDAVDFGPAEERAAERRRETQWEDQYPEVFVSLRNLLTAGGDGNDSSSTVTVAATAIANFIRDGAREHGSAEEDDDRYDFVQICWQNMDMMAGCIPPHHPWHAALVGAVRMLHARGDEPIFPSPDQAHIKWGDLTDLCYGFWDFYDGMMPFRDMREDEQEGPEARRQVARWKNWVSWFAQMPENIAIPYYAMRAIKPLEEPAAASPTEAECDFWTACEWLIHTAGTVLNYLMKCRAVSDKEGVVGRASLIGNLCRETVSNPWSIERWKWWKRRLAELAALDGVDAETKQHVAKAIASMEAAEAEYSAEEGRGKAGEEKAGEKDLAQTAAAVFMAGGADGIGFA